MRTANTPALAGALLLLLGGCYDPSYPAQYVCSVEHPQCPAGYSCDEADERCVKQGTLPDRGMQAHTDAGSDRGTDGTAGHDGMSNEGGDTMPDLAADQ